MKHNKVIFLAVLFGLSAWIIDTIFDYLIFFKGGSFFDVLFFEIPAEKYLIRLILVLMFFLFGIIIFNYLKPLEEAKKNFEKIIKQKEEFLSLTNDIFVALDREGIVLTISDKGASILGFTKDEIIGVNWFNRFVPPRLQFEIRNVYERLTISDSDIDEPYESSVLAAGGVEKQVLWHHKIVRNEQNIITGYYLSGIDVTEKSNEEYERNRLSDEVERQTHLLEMILTSTPDQLMMFDKAGKYTYCNEVAAGTFGLRREELIGKTWSEIGMPNQLVKTLDAKREWAMVSGKPLSLELTIPSVNGEKEFEYKLTPIRNLEGVFDNVIVDARDITERKNKEVELILAREKAQESDRLKSEFLTQMSHEIRTPLHTILSYLGLIKEELKHGNLENLNSSFNSIDVGSKRLLRTIELILNMSQIQTGTYLPDFRELDITKDIIEGIVKEYSKNLLNPNLEIIFRNETEESVLNLDYYTASQIFRNLIDNAVKYTGHGSVEVRIYKNENGKTCVEITDTGNGIGEEYLEKIFEPFSQEESGYTRHYEGNGLGLALAKKYCALNHAEITVKSEKGKGTRFTVVFSNPVHKIN